MDYVTNYYKNLCEELQSKIDLIEAGFERALRTISSERREKELMRQEVRRNAKLRSAARHNRRAEELLRRNPSQAGKHAKKGETDMESARKHAENIEEIEMQIDFEKPERRRAIQQELRNRGIRTDFKE